MSATSTISNLKSALDCASKCDCCAKLQAQINAINAKLLTEAKVRQIVNDILNPKITEVTYHLDAVSVTATQAKTTAGNALAKTNNFESTLAQMNAAIAEALGTAKNAISKAVTAQGTATQAQGTATTAQGDARAAQVKADRASNTASGAEAEAHNASEHAGTASRVANRAQDDAFKAQNDAFSADRKATNSLDVARKASLESELAKGIANQADFKAGKSLGQSGTAISESSSAVRVATSASKEALDANSAVGGLKGLVEGLKGRVGALGEAIAKLENAVGGAVVNAAKAVGISESALAATGRLAGKIAEIFNIIGTFAVLAEQFFTLETLGRRIDAVERAVEAVGNSVSGILGKLLGLQNRIANNEATIGQVRGIALDAKAIGEGANLRAGAAYILAGQAQTSATAASGKASQAQTTADGAVRNAATANENATTAYTKAVQAESVGEQAKRIGQDALGKAGVALTTALTALALYQGIKSLRGLQGIPGIPGRQGERGLQGLQGISGRDGANGLNGTTTVIQVPGVPGRDGAPGRQGSPGVRGQRGSQGVPGIAGRNGIDVNPAELSGLRALIVQQHAQTRTVVNATTTGLFGRLQTIIAAGNAGLTALVTAIATNTYVEKALAVLTFAATVHNAFMLSNNLAQTLGTIIDQVLGFILPKGLDGTPLNIGNILGKVTHEIIADTVGEANYTTISQDWAKANRIYQASCNVFNQVSNAVGILSAGLEVIGGNLGKIGNALKIWGVIGQKAYGWMNPQPNMQGKFFDFVQGASQELSTIQTVIAIPIAMQAAAIGINDSRDQLIKALDQTDPVDANGHPIIGADGLPVKYQPGIAIPEPTVTSTTAAQKQADSTNFVQATIDDIFNAND